MSVLYFMDDAEREQYEHENQMYHRIMRNGKLDQNGYLIEPPSDMSEEEEEYYRRLLKDRHGKIQYTV